VSSILMTGFPGFLGSALLPRLLARGPDVHAWCLVQPQHQALAEQRIEELAREHPHVHDRVQVLTGDLTARGLGLDAAARRQVHAVSEVWHLAAVYDLAVGEDVARRVNVEGTDRVLELCRGLPGLQRLHYVSTCYVSGRYAGEFGEDVLDQGQEFRNHYEETKFEAELAVRKAMADGLPVTIYRPGIVVGDSATGETQKYDGPYFLAQFLRRQPRLAVVPALGDIDRVRVCLVPRDFVVDAMDRLSAMDASLGKTYALTDPHPPAVREVVDAFAARLGRRVLWVRLPVGVTRALVGGVPGMERLLGLPAEALEYFASPTTYATTNTVADLRRTGVACPPFASYADRLIDYMLEHPEFGSAAMT
jgi:thioester reductase-like protein